MWLVHYSKQNLCDIHHCILTIFFSYNFCYLETQLTAYTRWKKYKPPDTANQHSTVEKIAKLPLCMLTSISIEVVISTLQNPGDTSLISIIQPRYQNHIQRCYWKTIMPLVCSQQHAAYSKTMNKFRKKSKIIRLIIHESCKTAINNFLINLMLKNSTCTWKAQKICLSAPLNAFQENSVKVVTYRSNLELIHRPFKASPFALVTNPVKM